MPQHIADHGYVDMHCHILPGVDDGSKDIETSTQMLRIAAEEGIGTIVCTPHNMPHKGAADRIVIEERIDILTQVIKREGLEITLLPGSEIYYRKEILEQLEEGRIVTLNESNTVLVEFDPTAERRYIVNALQELSGEGLQVVLAHVERYPSLVDKHYDTLFNLKEQGILLQVNCGSLMGGFGFSSKQLTRSLLKEGLIDLVSTDAHSAGKRSPRMHECAEYLSKKCGEHNAEALLWENAANFLDPM